MSTHKKICFFICIYLLLIMTTRPSSAAAGDKSEYIKAKLATPTAVVTLTDILGLFNYDQTYEGSWSKEVGEVGDSSIAEFIDAQQGRFRMYIDRQTLYTTNFSQSIVQQVQLEILNGDYIDKGALYYTFYLDNISFDYEDISDTKAIVYLNTSKEPTTVYYRMD
jgi:hypothetical protein